MAMDDDARVRWQQGLTEDMKYLILLIRQCLEENASLRESVSGLGDGVAKEQKKTKRLKKELKRNDIANLLAIVSDQGKCIKKLKKDFKDVQAVVSYMGCIAGICIPNASSKNLRRAYENKFQLSFSKQRGSAFLDRVGE